MTNKGILTCPECGHKQDMEIPETACIPMYTCDECGETIQAKAGCCVFCDYGDKPCPVAEGPK